jgi:hypothetical protein
MFFQCKQKITEHYHRHYVLTGIPRSGTSLVCKLMNMYDNSICLNEVWYDTNKLIGWFFNIRLEALIKGAVPNRFDCRGELTTDTRRDGQEIKVQLIDKPIDDNVLIGLKINAPFLIDLDKLIWNRIPVIAMVRDPVFTIASWADNNMNETHPETDPRYKRYPFKGKTTVEKQAEIWEWYAKRIDKFRELILVITYESLSTNNPIPGIADIFELSPVELPDVENRNDPDRFHGLDEIREAVKKFAPAHKLYGYEL